MVKGLSCKSRVQGVSQRQLKCFQQVLGISCYWMEVFEMIHRLHRKLQRTEKQLLRDKSAQSCCRNRLWGGQWGPNCRRMVWLWTSHHTHIYMYLYTISWKCLYYAQTQSIQKKTHTHTHAQFMCMQCLHTVHTPFERHIWTYTHTYTHTSNI